MRPYYLTDTNRQHLSDLAKLGSGIRSRISPVQRDQFTQLMEKIRRADELEAVMWLVPHLNRSTFFVTGAVDTIVSLLDNRDPIQIAQLDERCRRYSDYSHPLWNASQRAKKTPSMFREPLIHGLFSLHPSGRTREAAVRALEHSDNSEALTFLLLRTNDWVPQVREPAVAEVMRLATPMHVDRFVQNIELIERCTTKTRFDFKTVRSRIDALLASEPAALERGLNALGFRARRAIYTVAMDADAATRRRFAFIGMKDQDPIVRLRSVQTTDMFESEAERAQMIDALLNDPFSGVRLAALRLALEQPRQQRETLLRRFALDRTRSIRHTARFYLLENRFVLNSEDFAALYVRQIKEGNALVGILGLGECGNEEHLPALREHLGSPKPSVASAALDTVCRLSTRDETELLVDKLASKRPRLSKTAAHWLSINPQPQTFAACMALLASSELSLHVYQNAFKVALKQDKWTALEAILKCRNHPEDAIKRLARNAYSHWHYGFNRSFTQPDKNQKARLLLAIENAQLSESQATVLRSLF